MRQVSQLMWLWPMIIILSVISVGLVTFVFPYTMIRPAVVMGFLFVCPGITVVRFFRLAEFVVEWMLSVALSFVIGAFTASILLYAGWWSPLRILSILMGFCLIGAIMQLVIMHLNVVPLKLKHRHSFDSKEENSLQTSGGH